jgi:hypothetical protein
LSLLRGEIFPNCGDFECDLSDEEEIKISKKKIKKKMECDSLSIKMIFDHLYLTLIIPLKEQNH